MDSEFIDIYDDIFLFDNEFKKLILDGRYEEVLNILGNLLKNEKNEYNKMKSFLDNMLDSDLGLDELDNIERTYSLLDICSTRVRMLNEFIEKIKCYIKL